MMSFRGIVPVLSVSEPTVSGVAELLLPLMSVFQIVSFYVMATGLMFPLKMAMLKILWFPICLFLRLQAFRFLVLVGLDRGAVVASWLVCSTLEHLVWVRTLAGILCCVLGQHTLLSQCLSPLRCINGYR